MSRTLSFLFFLSIVQMSFGQNDKQVSIFHRLLIYNSEDELMVLKIENTDYWVTPGLYQTEEQSILQGLDSIASTYGISLESVSLRGVFVLKRDINSQRSTSLRHVYVAQVREINLTKPKGIEEITWLTPKMAMKKITFPHIVKMIEQIEAYPEHVRGGTLLQFRENDAWQTKILEEFYSF